MHSIVITTKSQNQLCLGFYKGNSPSQYQLRLGFYFGNPLQKRLCKHEISFGNPSKIDVEMLQNRGPRGLPGGSWAARGSRTDPGTISGSSWCLQGWFLERSWGALGRPGGTLGGPSWPQEASRSMKLAELQRIKFRRPLETPKNQKNHWFRKRKQNQVDRKSAPKSTLS